MKAAEVSRRMADAAQRLTRVSPVLRVRGEDAARFKANGGTTEELLARIEAAVAAIEKAAAKLTATV